MAANRTRSPERQAPRRPAVTGTAPRLYERASQILAAEIADGTLAPGARLLESRIANRFHISRAPARQALAELEAHGLVVRSAGRGFVVKPRSKGKASSRRMQPDTLVDRIRLSPEPSWERIYKEVEQEIVAHTAFASWRIIEGDLAEYYGVSRTVARDVMARLQQRGIVKKDEKSRWYAPGLTSEYVAELYELRAVLEPVALLNAMPRVPAGFVTTLRKNLEAAMARSDQLTGADLDALENQLHVQLLDYCGNRTLMEALGLYQSLLIAHSFLYRWTPPLYPAEPFLPEHLKVAERLEAGHVSEAAKALEEHLHVSLDRAVARIKVVARDSRPSALPYLTPLRATASR
ncbi:GntR family transcriptional regulator [Dongia deserti]|uniref:GntR family transcriptional regulator n=1 Tax=Dongia deserti TaxID=2268030 RepID=UPI000E6552FB|nr:GntR family transcriptional regulator [Dongia deserti]